MARGRGRKGSDNLVGITTRAMRKNKKAINQDFLLEIDPLTDNQEVLYDAYDEGKNIVAYGAAGTGKTFITLWNALKDVLNENTPYEKIYIVRSLVATREIGFSLVTMKISLLCIRFHTRTW